MSFTKENLPSPAESLTDRQKEKFVEIANTLIEKGVEESAAIPIAVYRSKKRASTKKPLTPEILKATNDEEQIAIDVVYEPFKPDAHGQWMSESTIRKACANFNTELANGAVKPNLFHLSETDKFIIEKSWINEVECVIGDQIVPEGAWLIKTKYLDPELWEMKKSGELMGVSIGCQGVIHPAENDSQE